MSGSGAATSPGANPSPTRKFIEGLCSRLYVAKGLREETTMDADKIAPNLCAAWDQSDLEAIMEAIPAVPILDRL